MNVQRKPILLLAALVALLSAPALRADWKLVAEGKFDRTLTVTGPVDLDVRTGAGSIEVRTGSADAVSVAATIKVHRGSRAEGEEKVRRLETNPPIEQNGNVIVIGRIEDRELRENVSISYVLTVPASTQMRSSTGSGSQTIDGIAGPLDAATGSGSITLSGIGNGVRAHTGSGSIRARGVKGELRADTGSGSIDATAVAGAITASTGSGSVEVEQTAAGDVAISTGSGGVQVSGVRGALRVRTGSGSITASGEPTGTWTLSTSSGSVTARLPQTVGFELAARTSSGRVITDHPVTLQGSISPRDMRGKVRGGGPLVELRTSSGNIRIE